MRRIKYTSARTLCPPLVCYYSTPYKCKSTVIVCKLLEFITEPYRHHVSTCCHRGKGGGEGGKGRSTLSLLESVMETFTVVLTFESKDEILCVTIQMKPRQQYFLTVLFIFKFFQNVI